MDSSFFLTIVAAAFAIGFFIFLRKLRIHQENEDVGSSSTSHPSCLASSTSHPSSTTSPSSSLSCTGTHHVFPSFRGEDVRRNFLSHIQKEFRRKGITPFIDNDIRRGESIGPELIKAIRESKIAIVLLSRNYASSKWCLDELVEIMECKKKFGLTVFAVFYEVDPSHVKKLTGEFGAVFQKTCKGRTKENIRRWRQAFEEVATIAGYDLRNWENEAAMIEEIAIEISKRLINSSPFSGFEGLIGMKAHIEKMKQLLCLDSTDERRTVGISGPSGIGKSTIARVLHNQISDGFQMSVFMKFKPSYTRPICSDDHDVKLQLEQQFLAQLINQEDIKIHQLGTAQNFVMGKKVLIVLDGVDQLVQLLAMPKVECLGPGSRIIITTQDQNLLQAFQIKRIYNVDFPPDHEALQIFCIHAFGHDAPDDGFKKLATKVTRLAGNLPLGLRVMGSHFRGMSKEDWKGELPRLRIRLDGEIGSILKFSYDVLDDEDKDLFLHIACFFNDEGIDHTFEDTLRHKFSNVQRGLRVLVQRSLISQEKVRPMHNLLVQLGREIVRNQSIYEPGKRQFLVDGWEICEVLTDHTGSESVIGINFKVYWSMDELPLNISDRVFEGMSNLQFLRFDDGKLHLPQGLNYLPPKLRILHWDYYPLTSLPSKFNPKFLVKIIMFSSKLEKLWEGIQPLANLKVMDLHYSSHLKELPNLSTATNLVDMKLCNCSSLMELPSSIGNATNIESLDLKGCSSLLKIPSSIGNFIALPRLDLIGCSSLVKLPSSIGNLINLWELDLGRCSSIVELPSSIGNLINLQKLYLNECSSLVELPSSIGNLINLQKLDLGSCSSLVKFPSSIGNVINLRELDLGSCSSIVELPSSIGNLINLKELNLSGCSSLVELPSSIGNVINLRELVLSSCSSIVELPSSIGNLINLQKLDLGSCSSIVELPSSIGNLINLKELNLSGFSSLVELPSSIGNVINLRELVLSSCSSIVELPSSIGNLINLQELDLRGCSSLVELPSSIGNVINLQKLDLCGCSSLVGLPSSFGNNINLQKLYLGDCSSLVKLPSSIGNIINLQKLYLCGCSSLVELPLSIENFTNIWELDLSNCSSLVELPSSIGNIINLQILDLSECSSLVELPSSIGNLRMLRKLILQGCSKIEVIPINIILDSLEELDVTGCSQLTRFPEISANIKRLMLGGTLIREIPLSIKSWSRLYDLRITYRKDLEEFPHALDIITDLELNDKEMKEVPAWVSGISRLRRLVLNKCTKLISLPQLSGSLKYLDAESCDSLETLACTFPNPEVCLKFFDCCKLNEKGRDIIIHTSTSEYTMLPGREVPAFFTYRATTGGSLAVKLNERHCRASLRFKACILLVRKGDKIDCEKWGYVYVYLTNVEKQSTGHKLSLKRKSPPLYPLLTEHLYTFEIEAGVKFVELVIEFRVRMKNWEIGECGIRPLLEEDTHVESFI